jgi:hypothetical protein
MQPVGLPAAVADEVKAEFAVSAFHSVINFAFRDRHFAHHDFEVVNEGFHFGVNVVLGRQIVFRYVGMVMAFGHIGISLVDNPQTLADFFLADFGVDFQ